MLSIWLDAAYVAPIRIVTEGLRARTHLARIATRGQFAVAYIKAFDVTADDRLLFNEVAGGVLARRAGIGAPPGGLLWVPLRQLQALFADCEFAHHQGSVPCYATAPITTGYGLAVLSLAQASSGVHQVIARMLLDWIGFADCVAFDEWVANVDRHANNILLASEGRLVPIDHSDCFGGPEPSDAEFVQPQLRYRNRLLEDHFEPDNLRLPDKQRVARAADRMAQVQQSCGAEIEYLCDWLGSQCGLNWSNWLEVRAKALGQVLRERLRLLI
jgi:hypothetical protein